MTFQIVYYTFSIATFLIVIIYIWNLIYYMRNGKTLIGLSFKKGTVEYQRMKKATSQPYIWIVAVALPLSLLNLALSVREVFQLYNKEAAIVVLVVYAFMVIVGNVSVFFVAKRIYGENTNKHSKTTSRIKPKDNNDDW